MHTIRNINLEESFSIDGTVVPPRTNYEFSDEVMAQMLCKDNWPETYSLDSPWGKTKAAMIKHLRDHPLDPSLDELTGITWGHMKVLYANGIFNLGQLMSHSAEDLAAMNGISMETASAWIP